MTNVMSHGGDGGGEPLHGGGHRVPAPCESRAPSRRKRGLGRSLNLQAAFDKNGQKPLPIKFDDEEMTFCPVGCNENLFVRFVGGQIRYYVIPCHDKWKNVPKQLRAVVTKGMEEYFNIFGSAEPYLRKRVEIGIDRTSAEGYKDYKNKAHDHFL